MHDDGLIIGLVSAYISVAGVLAVYHMFALQSWVSRCDDAEGNARAIAKATTADDPVRLSAQTTCEYCIRRYPWLQIGVMIIAQLALSCLTWRVGRGSADLSKMYSFGPVLLLLLIVVFATAATTVKSRRSMREAISLLTAKPSPNIAREKPSQR